MTILKLVEVPAPPGLLPGPGIPLLQVGYQKETEPKGSVSTAAKAAGSPVTGVLTAALAAVALYALHRLATRSPEPEPEPEISI